MSSFYVFLASSFKVAFKQLMRHKMRSFLTLLGILIGVSSVVAIVSLGEGLRTYFQSQMSSAASADLVYIMPDAPVRNGRWDTSIKAFKNRDVDALRASEHVQSAIGATFKYGWVAKYGWRSMDVTLMALPGSYFPLERMEIAQGRLFTRSEEEAAAMVCVLGSDLPKELMDFEDPSQAIGESVLIGGARLEVLGVLESKSALGGGGDTNKGLFVPLTTGQKRILGEDDVYFMIAQLNEGANLPLAKEDLESRLRQSRRIRSGADDDFKVSTPEDWAKFADTFVNSLIMVFGVVAVISLAVGGIGVMNIMLVSVKERTREIGLRKAVGATSGNITWQFLIEAISLSIIGGLLGILSGYATGGIAALALKAMFDVSWAPNVPMLWVAIVLLTCTGIGLAFGVYPAYRAGMLDPITALRYE